MAADRSERHVVRDCDVVSAKAPANTRDTLAHTPTKAHLNAHDAEFNKIERFILRSEREKEKLFAEEARTS